MLTKTSTLWALFALSLLCLVTIQLVANSWNLQLLDGVYLVDTVREQLEQMSAEQKRVHAWLTGTLDVAYPLIFGALLSGVALRFYPTYGRYLVLPVLLGVLADLVENSIQILALIDSYYLLEVKAYLTPAKFGFFIFSMAIAAIACTKWTVGKMHTTNRQVNS